MKLLKNIVLCLFMAVSVAGVSTTAYAESDPGRVTYTPSEAIKTVLERIGAAQEAIASNKSAEEVAAAAKFAKDFSKEINSEKIDRLRQNGNGHLNQAIVAAKPKSKDEQPNVTAASEHLAAAKAVFEEMLKKVNEK
jgi:hypothetical protein